MKRPIAPLWRSGIDRFLHNMEAYADYLEAQLDKVTDERDRQYDYATKSIAKIAELEAREGVPAP